MNKSAWRAVIRYFKVEISFKDYLGLWLSLAIVILAPLASILTSTKLTGEDAKTLTAVLTIFLAIATGIIAISMTASGYQDAASGKRLRLRLLPNGYFIYGTCSFIIYALYGLLIEVISCGLYAALGLGDGWMWGLKTMAVMTVLLLSVMPWVMLLSTLVKGIGSFLTVYMLTMIAVVFAAPITIGKIEFPFPFSFIPKLYYPLTVLLHWCTGNSKFFAVDPSSSALTAFGIFAGAGLVGYVLLALFYRRLLGSPSIASTAVLQAKLGKSTNIGKGW